MYKIKSTIIKYLQVKMQQSTLSIKMYNNKIKITKNVLADSEVNKIKTEIIQEQ